MDDNALTAFSKGLSSLLRHNQGGGLRIGPDGFAAVTDVVAAVNATRRPRNLGEAFDASALAEVVERDGKGRFELSADGTCVRAVSGHSFEVELPLTPWVPDGPLWFGTVLDKADEIADSGLSLSRKHKVRLLDSAEGALAVAEARGCLGPLVLEVDAVRLAKEGYAFGRTVNGEILVDRFGPGYTTPHATHPRPA